MIQFTDITALEILLAPEQGAEITARVLGDLQFIAQSKGELYSSQYSYSGLPIAQAMNACWHANPAGGEPSQCAQ